MRRLTNSVGGIRLDALPESERIWQRRVDVILFAIKPGRSSCHPETLYVGLLNSLKIPQRGLIGKVTGA